MATVEFYGETFTLTSEVSEWALMEFAEAAASGEDGGTMEGMASMLRLVQACVVDTDWARFRALARVKRADTDALLPVIQAAFAQAAERPTGRSSDSSDGPATTAQSSALRPADPATALFAGRPDRELAIAKTRQTA